MAKILLIKIFSARIYKRKALVRFFNSSIAKKKELVTQGGFSLIEILVALLLILVMVMIVPFGGNQERGKLEEILNKLENTVRFSQNESILRSVPTRILFKFNEEDQSTYRVQFSSTNDFILPNLSEFDDQQTLSLEEIARRDKLLNDISSNFSNVTEFKKKPGFLDSDIRLIAVGTSLRSKLLTDGQAAIYQYPSGERDAAIVFVAGENEMVSLTIEPFLDEIKTEYYELDFSGVVDEEEELINKAQEIYKKWKSRK